MNTSDPSKRRQLPYRRAGYTQRVEICGQKLYLHTGEYEDGTLGEIFIDVSKTGTVVRALLGAVAISTSLGLQHGVPLEEYVHAFKDFRFDPSGPVHGDPRIPEVASLLDYIFRELELSYLAEKQPAQQPEEPAP